MTNDAMKRVMHDFQNMHCDSIGVGEDGAVTAAILILAARVDELIEHFAGGENEHAG